jgi:septum formation protein
MLVLGSTSTYRRELLARLGLKFEVARPEVDETPLAQEMPKALAHRLAEAKARVVAKRFPNAWIIGSDQTAELHGQILGKPGDYERAADQLSAASGQRVDFYTSVCLMHAADGQSIRFTDVTTVQFRLLGVGEIERYLHVEQPYDCVGSFKSEGLGICLFDSIESRDPTALIGLPLIGLCNALRQAGFALP